MFLLQATMRKIRIQLNSLQWSSCGATEKIKSTRFTLTTATTATTASTATTATTTNIEMADIVDSSKQVVKSEQQSIKSKKDKRSSFLIVNSNQEKSVKSIATSNQVVAAESNEKPSVSDAARNVQDFDATPKNIFRNEISPQKNAAKKSILTLPVELLFGRKQRSYTLNE